MILLFSIAKIMPVSAMKACFQIAERSKSYAKIMQIECRISSLLEYYAEMQLILCKDYASERNESLLSNCRAQLILCKDLFFF